MFRALKKILSYITKLPSFLSKKSFGKNTDYLKSVEKNLLEEWESNEDDSL